MIKYNGDILPLFREKVDRYMKCYYETNKEILSRPY